MYQIPSDDHKATLETLKVEPYHFLTWVPCNYSKWDLLSWIKGMDFHWLATALKRSQVGLCCCLKVSDNCRSAPKVYRSTKVWLKVKGIFIQVWDAFVNIPIAINLEFGVSLEREDGSIFCIKLDKFINREDVLLNFEGLRHSVLFEQQRQTQGYGPNLWQWKSYAQKQNGLLKASSPWQLQGSNNSGKCLG